MNEDIVVFSVSDLLIIKRNLHSKQKPFIFLDHKVMFLKISEKHQIFSNMKRIWGWSNAKGNMALCVRLLMQWHPIPPCECWEGRQTFKAYQSLHQAGSTGKKWNTNPDLPAGTVWTCVGVYLHQKLGNNAFSHSRSAIN